MDFSPKNPGVYLHWRSGLDFNSANSLNAVDFMPVSMLFMTEQTIWLVHADFELELCFPLRPVNLKR